MTLRRKITLAAIIGVSLAIGMPIAWVGVVVYVAQPVKNAGTSMMPTYRDGDRLLIDKTAGHYDRGDVVVFWFPRDRSKSMIKRIVGLEGEQIEIREGRTYINGSVLSEPYVSDELNESPRDFGPEIVPVGHLFVMGDNRDHSNDSRFWGPVARNQIYGRVLCQYG